MASMATSKLDTFDCIISFIHDIFVWGCPSDMSSRSEVEIYICFAPFLMMAYKSQIYSYPQRSPHQESIYCYKHLHQCPQTSNHYQQLTRFHGYWAWGYCLDPWWNRCPWDISQLQAFCWSSLWWDFEATHWYFYIWIMHQCWYQLCWYRSCSCS